jgi:hypothetical protein
MKKVNFVVDNIPDQYNTGGTFGRTIVSYEEESLNNARGNSAILNYSDY